MRYEEATQPFEFGEGSHYVIACHGFSGNPYEMRWLGQHLADNGFHVVGPLLPGAGESKEALAKTRFPDWYGEVERTLEEIKARDPETIFMTGLSMGGFLTLYTGAHHPEVKALAPVAAPLYIKNKLLWLAPIMKHLMTYLPNGEEWFVCDESLKEDPILLENRKRYNKTVIPAALSLISHINQLRKKFITNVTQPILISHGKKDGYVEPANASLIYDKVSSDQKELLWLENSNHMATMDLDKELLFQRITQFFQAQLNT